MTRYIEQDLESGPVAVLRGAFRNAAGGYVTPTIFDGVNSARGDTHKVTFGPVRKAIARHLSANGAIVVITDFQCELGLSTAAAGRLTFLRLDVNNEICCREVVREVEARFGQSNTPVNYAGTLGSAEDTKPESRRFPEWKKLFAVNANSVFFGYRAAIPAMRRAEGGSIINFSSMAAFQAIRNAAAYGSGKSTVRQLSKSVAQHCAQKKSSICIKKLPAVTSDVGGDRRRNQ